MINDGGATAADIYTLINEIIDQVKAKTGVILEPEIKMLGEF